MYRQILSLLLAMAVMTGAASAQERMQRQTPEERIAATMEKMAPLNLSADQKTKATAVITDFFTARQKAMKEMRESGQMDREAMMAKRKEMSDARDAKLKEIFTAEQMKKWTDEIAPAAFPQRGPRGN